MLQGHVTSLFTILNQRACVRDLLLTLRCRDGVLGRWMGSFSAPLRCTVLSWITSRIFRIHSCFTSILDACRNRGQKEVPQREKCTRSATPATQLNRSNNTTRSRTQGRTRSKKFTFRMVLLSDVGVRPAHRANLHGSPSMCSVTPNSDVC